MRITKSIASYAGACLSIYLQALDRGMQLPLRGVQCVLCEDGLTAVLEVDVDENISIMASFALPEQVDDAGFDPRPYLEGFENA
jgi:hypothetical protein